MKTAILSLFFVFLGFNLSAQAQVNTLSISIESQGPDNSWLGVNSVGILNGKIVGVTANLKGNGCQMTRKNFFGRNIFLRKGSNFKIVDNGSSIAEITNCVRYEDGLGGDPECVEFGMPSYESLTERTLVFGSEEFSLKCVVPGSQQLRDSEILLEKSIRGLYR